MRGNLLNSISCMENTWWSKFTNKRRSSLVCIGPCTYVGHVFKTEGTRFHNKLLTQKSLTASIVWLIIIWITIGLCSFLLFHSLYVIYYKRLQYLLWWCCWCQYEASLMLTYWPILLILNFTPQRTKQTIYDNWI